MNVKCLFGIIALSLLGMISYSCDDGRTVSPYPSFLAGTVTDQQSNNPIDSVIVSARWDADTTTSPVSAETTGVDGRFNLVAGYRIGRAYVLAEKDGYLPHISEVYLTKQETVTLDFELQKVD